MPLTGVGRQASRPFFRDIQFKYVGDSVVLLARYANGAFRLLRDHMVPNIHRCVVVNGDGSIIFSPLLLSRAGCSNVQPIRSVPCLSLGASQAGRVIHLRSNHHTSRPILLTRDRRSAQFRRFMAKFRQATVTHVRVVMPNCQRHLRGPFNQPYQVLRRMFVQTTNGHMFTIRPVVTGLISRNVHLVEGAFTITVCVGPKR